MVNDRASLVNQIWELFRTAVYGLRRAQYADRIRCTFLLTFRSFLF